jgi:hypothetical protein
MITKSAICPGEELTWNYQWRADEELNLVDCYCKFHMKKRCDILNEIFLECESRENTEAYKLEMINEKEAFEMRLQVEMLRLAAESATTEGSSSCKPCKTRRLK